LLFIWTATLGICDAASTILDSLAFLFVGHLADFITDSVALLLFNCAALIFINCVTPGTSFGFNYDSSGW